jgi:hypothetical protein
MPAAGVIKALFFNALGGVSSNPALSTTFPFAEILPAPPESAVSQGKSARRCPLTFIASRPEAR